MAEIGWIDFSKADRKKAQQILSSIRPEGQLDELGVGSVRDALADQLFPGISTIQTRAKYFFIVPNILRTYQNLPAAKRRNNKPEIFLEEEQQKVKNRLKELYDNREGIGIIGVSLSSRQYIKRKPSDIYWNGLQVYGFMNSKGLSQDQLLKNLRSPDMLERSRSEEGEDDADVNHELNDDIHNPVNYGWFDDLSIDLTEEERDYFAAQIQRVAPATPNSLLPLLVSNKTLLRSFLEAGNFQQFVIRSSDIDFKPAVKKLLILAHDFAQLMEGVHLLYNHMLREHFFPKDYNGSFEKYWETWRTELATTLRDFDNFSPAQLLPFIKYPRPHTIRFIDDFWGLIKASPSGAKPSADMMELIRKREYYSKGTKSRLMKPISANPDVDLKKRIGLSLFQYRFYNARTIIKDILNPH